MNYDDRLLNIKKKLFDVHGDKIILDEVTYVNVQKKARFVHKQYGEWWAYPCNVIYNKTSHPKDKSKKISEKLTKNIDHAKEKLFQIHGNTVVLDESTYINTQKKARFIDIDYGEWWAKVCNVIYGKCGHPERARKKISIQKITPIDVIKNRLFDVHEDLVVLDETTYKGIHFKSRFIDKQYGEFFAIVEKVLKNSQRHPNFTKTKRQNTCLLRYGVKHSSQNKEIALKTASAQTSSLVLHHWKTRPRNCLYWSDTRKKLLNILIKTK